jgi:hypothetical protein
MIEPSAAKPDWPTCRSGHDCRGAQASPGGYCWRHLDGDDESVALDMLAEYRDLDFRGTNVPDYLLKRILDRLRDPADGHIMIRTARCTEASFEGGTGFEGTIFVDDALFNSTAFGAGTSFANVRFECNADFRSAKFGNAAPAGAAVTSFDGAIFQQEAWFADATFAGLATFTRTTFGRSVSFESTKFDTVRLTARSLGGSASFRDASVAGELTLGLNGNLDTLTFDRLHVAGQVDVQAEVATIRCEEAAFADRGKFLLANGTQLWLTDTVFSQPTTVQSWLRSSTRPTRSDSYRSQVTVRSLRGVDAEHLTLADVDLSHCLIYGLRRPDALRLSGRYRFAPTPRGWYLRWRCLPWHWTYREALYEEHLWRRTSVTARLGWLTETDPDEDTGAEPDLLRPAGLAVLYRQLRQGVEDARNEPGAADLYYGEMEMRRLSTQRWDERWLLTAYWLVSGYGLRASRSMLALSGFVSASAVALQRAGFPGHVPGYLDCLLYAAGSVLSLDLTGHLPAHLTDWGQLIRMLLRVAGPVLLGLGALAVRGRIKR